MRSASAGAHSGGALPTPAGASGTRPDPLPVATVEGRLDRALSGAFPTPVWIAGEVTEVREGDDYFAFELASPAPSREDPSRLWAFVGREDHSRIDRWLGTRGVGLRDLLVRGQRVSVEARVGYWPTGHRVELRVRRVDRDVTRGWMEERRAETRRRLGAEGVLERQRRQHPELALFVPRVAVVSGGESEGWGDVRAQLASHGLSWLAPRLLDAAPLEGDGAAGRIASCIAEAGRSGADVVLVVRGGGSRLGLFPFDDEAVARAIADAPVPVVTGIGHATDRTLADEAAWHAAPTPTAAAEVLARQFARARSEVGHASAAESRARDDARRRLGDAQQARRQRLALGWAALALASLVAMVALRSPVPTAAGAVAAVAALWCHRRRGRSQRERVEGRGAALAHPRIRLCPSRYLGQ